MTSTQSQLDDYFAMLPDAPRAVPDEVETLFGETRRAMLNWCWALAAAFLVAGCLYLPEVVRVCQLDMRGIDTVARIVDRRPTISFPFRRRLELLVEFRNRQGDLLPATITASLDEAAHLTRTDPVEILYDPYDPRSVRAKGWASPRRPLLVTWAIALALPFLGWWRIEQLIARRRQAFQHGAPVAAKVQGYSRLFGTHHVELQLAPEAGATRHLEAIAPAEVDRYSPLTTLCVLLDRTERASTCIIGELDNE